MATAKPAPQIERKTLSASLIATLIGVAVAALNGLEADHSLLGTLPATWQTIILALVPPALVYLTSYATSHTERTDLAAGDLDAEAAAFREGA